MGGSDVRKGKTDRPTDRPSASACRPRGSLLLLRWRIFLPLVLSKIDCRLPPSLPPSSCRPRWRSPHDVYQATAAPLQHRLWATKTELAISCLPRKQRKFNVSYLFSASQSEGESAYVPLASSPHISGRRDTAGLFVRRSFHVGILLSALPCSNSKPHAQTDADGRTRTDGLADVQTHRWRQTGRRAAAALFHQAFS